MSTEINAERTTDKYLPHRYAGASGDFNPIHIDPEFAKAVGFERNILHGLSTMAFVAKACTDAAGGDPRKLKSLNVRFAKPVLVEQTVTIIGKEESANGGTSLLIEVTNDEGETVISHGSATVDLG